MNKDKVVSDVLNSFIGARKTTNSQIHKIGDLEDSLQNKEIQEDTQKSQNHQIGGFEEKTTNFVIFDEDDDEKRRVWVLLSDKDKLFCKVKAREMKRKGIIPGGTYSDYIEYLIKKDMEREEEK